MFNQPEGVETIDIELYKEFISPEVLSWYKNLLWLEEIDTPSIAFQKRFENSLSASLTGNYFTEDDQKEVDFFQEFFDVLKFLTDLGYLGKGIVYPLGKVKLARTGLSAPYSIFLYVFPNEKLFKDAEEADMTVDEFINRVANVEIAFPQPKTEETN